MARVIAPFRDRETWRSYDVGDEYDGDRAAELAEAGLVEAAKPKASPKRRATRKTTARG